MSFDRARQLRETKQRAIGLADAGYHPPTPRAYKLPGESGIATLQMMVNTLVAGNYASEHDAKIAMKLANVLCGGARGATHAGHRGRDPRARARGVRRLCGEPLSPGAHAVHAPEQQAPAELNERTTMEIVIAEAVRSAVGRGHKGTLATKRPDELAADVIRGLLARVPQAKGKIDDVMLGCAMPEGEQGLNVARLIALLADLGIEVAGADDQPVLLERPAGDRDRRRLDRGRHERRRARRRRRVDDATCR